MNRQARRITVFVLLLAAILFPFFNTSSFWLDFVTMTLFIAVLGQGWNILGGYGGQFSFGHAVFFGVGAYIQVILQAKFGISAWLAIPFATAGGIGVGLFIGYLSFRYGLRGPYFALITLAFAEAFRVLATSLDVITDGGQGMYLALNQDPARSMELLQFLSGEGYYVIAVLLTIVSLLIAWRLEHSRFGAQLMAVRENEAAAQALGVNAFRTKMWAIGISGSLTALGGVFYVQKFLFINPNIAFGPAKSIEALIVPIIGGMGTIFGPLLGATFLHGISEITKELSASLFADRPGLDLMIYGLILILMLSFLPTGLIGLGKRLLRHFRQRSKKKPVQDYARGR